MKAFKYTKALIDTNGKKKKKNLTHKGELSAVTRYLHRIYNITKPSGKPDFLTVPLSGKLRFFDRAPPASHMHVSNTIKKWYIMSGFDMP